MSELIERRKNWEPGPWHDEPDEHDFIDGTTGYPCALRRNTFGAWCGYIGVPSDHPWHGKGYGDEVPGAQINPETRIDEVGIVTAFCHAHKETPTIDMLVRCHGGLTYAREPWWQNETRATWFFGFDCAHSGDLTPDKRTFSDYSEVYRDMPYVIDCCKKAAADIRRATPTPKE